MNNKIVSCVALLALSLSCLMVPPAFAGKADDTLVVAWPKEVPNIDAYFSDVIREGVVLNYYIWDTLVYRDPKTNKYVPLLATSWKYENPTTIDFDLRHDVKFQNGQPFTADDVVYTINWAVNPDSHVALPSYVNWIEKAEKLGKYKVRIITKRPFPPALEFLADVIPIYPHEYHAKVGPQGFALHPIGTGPYKVTKVVPGKEVDLVKNSDYFSNSPKGKPHIGKIVMRVIPDKSTQIADLISGQVDWIYQVPIDQAEKLKTIPNVTVKTAGAFRFGYLTMDAAGRSGKDNPFTKLKVRQAVSYAIDRQAIVDSLVKGVSKVINSVCSPMQVGCTEDVMKYHYDPAKAKKLLAEAGYPHGFTTEFYAYRQPEYAQAMMGYLTAVGIKTKFQQLQYSALRDKIRSGKVPFAFMTWGSNSIGDISASTSAFFEGEPDDMARDPKVEALLKQADGTVDKTERAALYKQALERIAQQAYWLPLFTYSINYAFSKDLDWTPTNDEVFRLFQAKWK